VKWEDDGKGGQVRVENSERIPLLEGFDLGKEKKGMEMNNSGRLRNNFGMNREALFPGGTGMKNETRNWVGSFTKTGCVSCRDENGGLNHRGRDGLPVVLLIGDEAVPSAVGYTGKDRNEGKGDSCVWVLKVEHLGLEEVSGILRRINLDKRSADRASGKREHEFFVPNGSKILVSSYVHLRKEGIDGYMGDFNTMAKNVAGVTGNAGIEVLPVVPVVREGVDQVGRELIGMVKEWVDWIGKESGRESVRRLSATGGCESEKDRWSTYIWKPCFYMKVTDKGGLTDRMAVVTGERTETRVNAAVAPMELRKMMMAGRGESGMETDESERLRSEENGVSMECEFTFSKAVGEFLREEVRAGTFRGNYVLNLKEQLRVREWRENETVKKVRVLMVGASQMNRLGDEMRKRHGDRVEVVGCVRMEGENTAMKNKRMVQEVGAMIGDVDVVVLGGPTNSLVRHGKEGERGFGGERLVKVKKLRDGREEWNVTYHLTDPVKISMMEKAELVEQMVDLLGQVKGLGGNRVRVIHLTMFPCFTRECCRGHMTDEDVWLLDGVRRDVNKDIVDTLTVKDMGVETMEWWTLLGAKDELTLTELRRMNCIDADNVHLTTLVNRSAADILCHRLVDGKETDRRMENAGKRRRME
jgi:hypothetical protein